MLARLALAAIVAATQSQQTASAPLQPADQKEIALIAVDRSGKDGYEDTITAAAMKDPVPWPWVGGKQNVQLNAPVGPDGNPWPYYNGVSPNGINTQPGTYVPWYPSDLIGGIPTFTYPEFGKGYYPFVPVAQSGSPAYPQPPHSAYNENPWKLPGMATAAPGGTTQ